MAVIVNALRALRGGSEAGVVLPADTESLVHRFAAEHDELRDALPMLRDAADLLAADGVTPCALEALRHAHRLLVDRLLPHERAEETQLYPALAAPLGSTEATATMSRMHAEIERLSRRLGVHLEQADAAGGLRPEQVEDLLACLYGLFSVLRLHFVQEEENYFALASDAPNSA